MGWIKDVLALLGMLVFVASIIVLMVGFGL